MSGEQAYNPPADNDRIRPTNSSRKLAERCSIGGDLLLPHILSRPACEMDASTLSQHMFGNRCGFYGGMVEPRRRLRHVLTAIACIHYTPRVKAGPVLQ